MAHWKDASLRLLARAGLQERAYLVYERLRSARAPALTRAPDGLPVPPPRLLVRVAGTPDAEWFLESGRLAADTIREALERQGRRIEDVRSLLDFGCGCGRVLRHWRELDAEIWGSDRDADLVAWSRQHLPFARFERNGLEPPLALASGSFELVYALSVFTHLPEEVQLRWCDELARLLEPGGYLLLTTHGEAYVERLSPRERARFESGELVVRRESAAGSNLCTAFHPPAWVADRLTRGLQLLEHVPQGARGNPHQDLFVLRKPAA